MTTKQKYRVSSKGVLMNIDKIRVVGSLCNAITGEYANPRIWGHLPVANLVHPNNAVAFIGYCQHGSEYYIEGSPLSWFLGRNDCGPCALDLLDSWVDAVVAIAYPDLKFVISRITYCEVFAMINAGDRQTVDHTVEYIDAFASIKYSREDINCYPSIVGPGTLYSRDIVGLRVTNYLLRIYNKSAQQYECSPMLFALPTNPVFLLCGHAA